MKRLGLLVLMMLWLGGAAQGAERYELILLDSLDDWLWSDATAINNYGEVVGVCLDIYNYERATYWDPSKDYAPVDIGTLPGTDSSVAAAINDNGDVVGMSYLHSSNANKQVFIWNAKTRNMVALQGLPGSTSNEINSIDSNGKAYGYSKIPAGRRACIFQLDKAAVDISGDSIVNPVGDNAAIGVSDSGMVVGNEIGPRTNRLGKVVCGQGNFKEITILNPGPLSGMAYAINKNGCVAGICNTSDYHTHAFFWDGALHDLGTLGGTLSYALALNDSSQVVGWSYTALGLTNAFLYQPGQVMSDVNRKNVIGKPFNYRFEEAWGINNRGEIVGKGSPRLAFLLRPYAIDIGAFLMMLLCD